MAGPESARTDRVPPFAAGYRRPELAEVEREGRALAARCAAAGSPEAFLQAVREWNRARRSLDTLQSIALVRYRQDTRDPAAKAEQDFWNGAAPLLRELEVLCAQTLLASRHGGALEREFGPQLLALKRCAAPTFAAEIRESLAEEARLVSAYTELLARSELEFRGEKLSLSAIGRYFSDADRATRLEAQRSRDAFLSRHAEELDETYERLVALRDGMGRALGHADFVPLGYQLMQRIGYGPGEVAAFREAIRREVVPLVGELRRAQARRLGLDRVLFHDEPVWDPRGNPRPRGDARAILESARRMYAELHPEAGEFFEMLLERELLDVELRDGKAAGGFCTQFPDQRVPFVFANFNGSDHDIHVITHECGHAFQAWSSRGLELLEFGFPTLEACEVHSMGMEFLTYPWMPLFFGEDADRYRRIHLEESLAFLPYFAAVDHFQHEVYRQPGLPPNERHALWLEMERRYLPERSYGGLLPYCQRGAAWQRQLHIYVQPFYYIDYGLAQVCALQLFQRAASDRAAALGDYLALCRAGGSRSFAEMLALGRLRSPFDPAVLREAMDHARAVLAASA